METLRGCVHPGRKQCLLCVGVVGHWEDTEPTEMKTDALFLTLSVFNSVVTLLLNPTNDTQDFGSFFFL